MFTHRRTALSNRSSQEGDDGVLLVDETFETLLVRRTGARLGTHVVDIKPNLEAGYQILQRRLD
jgi:hypothetical protein